MTRPEEALTRAIEAAERDQYGGKVMLSVEEAKRLLAMVERPEMHEDPAHRARSLQNIAHQLREYAEQRHYDEKAERHLDANGFSDREWLRLKLAAITLLLIVGIAVWGWLG